MAQSRTNTAFTTPGSPYGLAAQLAALQRAGSRPRRRARRQVGIQSVEAGIGVLKVLVGAGRPMKL